VKLKFESLMKTDARYEQITPWAIVPFSFNLGKSRGNKGEVDSSDLENGMGPIVTACANFWMDEHVRLILSCCCAVIGQRSIRLNKLPRLVGENDKRESFLLRDDLWSVVSRHYSTHSLWKISTVRSRTDRSE